MGSHTVWPYCLHQLFPLGCLFWSLHIVCSYFLVCMHDFPSQPHFPHLLFQPLVIFVFDVDDSLFPLPVSRLYATVIFSKRTLSMILGFCKYGFTSAQIVSTCRPVSTV